MLGIICIVTGLFILYMYFIKKNTWFRDEGKTLFEKVSNIRMLMLAFALIILGLGYIINEW